MRVYSSFNEVDRDLKILKLQNEIDKEEARLHFSRTKEALSPKYLIKNAASVVKRKALEVTAMAKGAGEGFLEQFNSDSLNRSVTEIRVEPVEKEIVVEEVIIKAETDDFNNNRI